MILSKISLILKQSFYILFLSLFNFFSANAEGIKLENQRTLTVPYINWSKVVATEGNASTESLTDFATINYPSHAFESPYPHVLLQSDDFIVCVHSCDIKQSVIKISKGDTANNFQLNKFKKFQHKKQLRQLEATNVYYWLSFMFATLKKEIGFTPKRKLIVVIDRKVKDPLSGNAVENNAFFDSESFSLSFVPKDNSLLYGLLGYHFRDSSLDPSVIIHEAGHSVFDGLTYGNLNEVKHLHEGFADFLSHVLLDTPKIGQVMIKKKAVRSCKDSPQYDFTTKDPYANGNTFACILYGAFAANGRDWTLVRSVFEAAKDLGTHPFEGPNFVHATIMTNLSNSHSPSAAKVTSSFKDSLFPTETYPSIEQIPSEIIKSKIDHFIKTKLEQSLSPKYVKEFGIPAKKTFLGAVLSDSKTMKDANGDEVKLYKISVENESVSNAVWLAESKGQIRGLFYMDGEAFDLSNSEDLKLALEIKEKAKDIIDWSTDFKSNFREVILGKGDAAKVFKIKQEYEKEVAFEINQKSFSGIERKYDLKLSWLAKRLDWLTGGMLRDVAPVEKISVRTVSKESLSSIKEVDTLLASWENESEYIVGMTFYYYSGTVESYQITDLK